MGALFCPSRWCDGLRLSGAAVLGALSVACSVHQEGYEDPLTPPASFPSSSPARGAPVPDRWWIAFKDPILDQLQQQALAGNFDLATYRDRLAAASAIVRRDRAALSPTVDYTAFAQQTRRSGNDFESEERFGASVIGAYDIDLWRQNANIAASARLQQAIAREQLKAAAISLTADVALTWYALVEQRAQANVLDEQVETNRKVLYVVRTRFGAGLVRASDVLRQERLLESTLEQRANVQSRIEVLEHALLVLTARLPTEPLGAEPIAQLPPVPPQPELGLPSDLVQRRPDVRSAVFAIADADARVAIAVAERYPSVSLSLGASTAEERIADLFDDWASTLSIDVLGPIFDAGAREAEADRARAVKAERVNIYAQSVLQAFAQVMDAISQERARIEQISRIERQLELARRTTERLNREYLNGDISYIDVLEALTTQQQLQRDLISARSALLAARIALYRALAGGWDGIADPPDRADAEPSTGGDP